MEGLEVRCEIMNSYKRFPEDSPELALTWEELLNISASFEKEGNALK